MGGRAGVEAANLIGLMAGEKTATGTPYATITLGIDAATGAEYGLLKRGKLLFFDPEG